MNEQEDGAVIEDEISEEPKRKKRSKKEDSPQLRGMSEEELDEFSTHPIVSSPHQPLKTVLHSFSEIKEPTIFKYRLDLYS